MKKSVMISVMKIHSGDKVRVVSGKDRGKTGKVEKALPQERKVVVSGVNVVKKHMRATREREGGIVEKTLPIDVSNVMLLCPKCEQPTRVGYQVKEGKKWRICEKCEAVISRP